MSGPTANEDGRRNSGRSHEQGPLTGASGRSFGKSARAKVRPLTVELIAELEGRKAEIALIPRPLDRLIAASKWHIETNGEGAVGKDGRATVTIAAIMSTHAMLDAIKFAQGDNGAPLSDGSSPKPLAHTEGSGE